jgi:hypothetical protein
MLSIRYSGDKAHNVTGAGVWPSIEKAKEVTEKSARLLHGCHGDSAGIETFQKTQTRRIITYCGRRIVLTTGTTLVARIFMAVVLYRLPFPKRYLAKVQGFAITHPFPERSDVNIFGFRDSHTVIV